MNKKQEIIKLLTRNNNNFSEFSNITEEDFLKIITLYEDLYEKEFLKSKNFHKGDPYYPTTMNLLAIQKSIYETIKNNNNYRNLVLILEPEYETELNKRLKRTVYSYGEPTNETYQAPYSEMPEYSVVLADMCSRRMEEAQKQIADSKEVILPESSLQTYETIKKDLISVGINMPERSEAIAKSTQELITQKNERETAIVEAERHQKEIELITLQQEINRIENEKLEVEKRIKLIQSETLGSYFTHQVSEKFPDEYNTYQQYKEQVQRRPNGYSPITDLKEKFSKISEDLEFYKTVLPIYESFYQRFEQMKNERKNAEISEKEQGRIYNLIYSEENERLKRNRSLYTAWDLENRTIPQKYQGLTYEQVEAMINHEKEASRLKEQATTTREDLIGRSIKKDLGVSEDYRLSDVQIKNLRQQFETYSNEELVNFINGVKKEEKHNELRQEVSKSYETREKALISYIESRDSHLGKINNIISVTGYPDSIYEIKFDNGEIHTITVTQEEQQKIYSSNQSQNINQQDMKNNLINEVLSLMYPEGLEYVPLPDIKRQLDSYSFEQLEIMKNQYQQQNLENTSSGKQM
jgi:hypothetical protein